MLQRDLILVNRYDNNHVMEKIHGYKNDEGEFIKHGTATFWHENGNKSVLEEYVDDLLQGRRIEWYESGNKELEEEQYDKGKLTGIKIEWHKNGTIRSRGEYKIDEKYGKHKEWSEDGILLKEEEYKDGELNGVCIYYMSEVVRKSSYVDGILNGLETWYLNGVKMLQREFNNGLEVKSGFWMDEKFGRMLKKEAERKEKEKKNR